MREVSGPIIAIALTLCAVFVPLAFMTGLSGQFYKQFAMTIAISTVISAFNSLTLSPALSALLLKGHHDKPDWLTRGMNRWLGGFFNGFNRVFGRASESYATGVSGVIRRKASAMGVYAPLLALTVGVSYLVPGGFVPAQDKQYLIGFTQLPNGASLDRTDAGDPPHVGHRAGRAGVQAPSRFRACRSTGSPTAPARASCSSRSSPSTNASRRRFLGRCHRRQPEPEIPAPSRMRISRCSRRRRSWGWALGGFKLQLEDRAALGYAELDKAAQAFLAKAAQTPELGPSFSSYQINVPQLDVDLDRVKAKRLGVPVTDVFDTMQIYRARSTSTTSTASAGCSRCARRPTRRFTPTRTTSCS